jgi:hypothetical protein
MHIKLIFAVILVALFVGCTTGPQCNNPYIWRGNDCCLDLDGNNICDNDESRTTTTSTTLIITKTAKEVILTEKEIQGILGSNWKESHPPLCSGHGREMECIDFDGGFVSLISSHNGSLEGRKDLYVTVGVYDTVLMAIDMYNLRKEDDGIPFANGNIGIRTRNSCSFVKNNVLTEISANNHFATQGYYSSLSNLSYVQKWGRQYGDSLPPSELQIIELCRAQEQKIGKIIRIASGKPESLDDAFEIATESSYVRSVLVDSGCDPISWDKVVGVTYVKDNRCMETKLGGGIKYNVVLAPCEQTKELMPSQKEFVQNLFGREVSEHYTIVGLCTGKDRIYNIVIDTETGEQKIDAGG